MALATRSSASSWPTTRCRRRSSMVTSFLTSPSSIFETGMPVHLETMRATSSSSTSSFNMRVWARARRIALSDLRGQLLQFFFRLPQQAVANLRHALQIAFALFRLLFDLELLDFLFQRARAGRSGLSPASSWLSAHWIFRASRPALSRSPPAALSSWRRLLSSAPAFRFRAAWRGAPADRFRWAWNRSGCAAMPPLHRSGRWLCRAGSGRRCSDATRWPRPRWRSP